VSKWIEIDQDNLRIGTAKAVARLMSFAQITCISMESVQISVKFSANI